ncbi:Wzz/FepE/Etk N-terminal domain-containing protein [Sphingomonas bacterium]|uniref:Wzz/FepE/Etk N-terminal domain-containing protein n=1 Tax=Sphingomonas bacterium TaxID=1895847 RepID=UPI0015769767|nr:Wzz/FepE/Etk N-terminal domain-containing protein [Sphingomonas bacterium]
MFSSDLVLALRSRWKTVATVLAAVLVLAVAWLLVTERTYTARASLLFDDRGPSPELQDKGPAGDNRALLGTQADILKSDAVARRVIEKNNLLVNPDLRREWQRTRPRTNSFEPWLTGYLLAHLAVAPERDTNVLAVRYTANDPVMAARLANGFASSFVAMRMQISTDTAKQYATWFQQRTDEVRGRLERAQLAVTNFQRSHGMVDGNALALEADRLSALSTQLASAEGVAADLRSRAGTRVSQSPDVQSSAVVQSLRQEIAAADGKISELSASHGDQHPDMLAARAELATLRGKLSSETSGASQSVMVASSAATAREGELQGLVASQRARMLALNGYRGQLEKLQNDVNTAQRAYETVTQRLNLMRLQSGLPTTNAQQVDRATPPLLPTKPDIPLTVLLATIAGLVLGVLTALLIENQRPRVRTPQGLMRSTGLPVIGGFAFGSFLRDQALRLERI